MAPDVEALAIAAPGVRASRWSCTELYAGVKGAYAIGRVEHGRSEYRIAGRVWRSAPGVVLLEQPGDVHQELAHDGRQSIQVVSIAATVVEAAVGPVRVQPQLAAADPRSAVFHRLHDAVTAKAERLVIEVLVAEAIAAFSALRDDAVVYVRPVRRALELLRSRLAEPITLDELAAHAGLDKFHLCRAFRSQVGLPPYAYLTQLRILRARQLLADGVSPSEVAPQIGLYDQSLLNRHFRRIVGTTPGEYARRN